MLPEAKSTWTLEEAAHLLNRAGFGGSPEEVRKLHGLGREKAVDSLIGAEDEPEAFALPAWAEESRAIEDMRERVRQRREMQREIRDLSPEEAEKRRREMNQAAQRENRRNGLDAQGWWFRRMLGTKAPLREKMTLFWHDHFATSLQKVRQPALMLKQNELFRKHAFGSFKELTREILVDPAMMLYLDVQNSRKAKPNENFAREVFELFTLGEGHYTEEDIREAARAFTGYQLNRMNGRVVHNRRQWDTGEKTIFGKTGPFDGPGVVDLIFARKQPARFISAKLWEFFAYDSPSDTAVDALAEIVSGADFRVAPLLREMFLSREFYSEKAMRAQIKSPVQFLVGMLKHLELPAPPAGFPISAQQQLGQVLFMPPNVAGWDWGKAWINTNTLLTRYNLAGFLTKGAGAEETRRLVGNVRGPGMDGAARRMARTWSGPDYEKIAPRPLREDPAELVDALISRFFHGRVPSKARDSFVQYAKEKKGVVFTNTEVGELCHLMLSTPYYQLC